jgi:prefoldin subunit 5
MIDTTQIEMDSNEALASLRAEQQRLRSERKEINVRLAELVIEERRLQRITNAFKPRTRKASSNGESE